MLKQFLAAACFFTAISASAQEFSKDWTVLGTMTSTIDGENKDLFAIASSDGTLSTVDDRTTGGLRTLNVAAMAAGSDGEPAEPTLSFLFGPWLNGQPDNVSVDFYTPDGFFMANIDVGGPVPFDSFDLQEDGTLSFAVTEIVLQEAKRTDDGAFEAVSGGTTLTVTASFEGTIKDGG